MKKFISIILISSLSLFATENSDKHLVNASDDSVNRLIKAKESYTNCVLSNLSAEENKFLFSNFIKQTPREHLTYKNINQFIKDYMISLLKEDICNESFELTLNEAIDFDKKLSKNSMFSKPDNFDYAAYNKNLIFDLTSSYIYFNYLLKEKR